MKTLKVKEGKDVDGDNILIYPSEFETSVYIEDLPWPEDPKWKWRAVDSNNVCEYFMEKPTREILAWHHDGEHDERYFYDIVKEDGVSRFELMAESHWYDKPTDHSYPLHVKLKEGDQELYERPSET